MFPYYAFSSAPFTTFDASYRNQDYAHPASSAIRRATPAAAAAASATHAPLAAPVAPPAPLLQPAYGPHTPAAVFPPLLWGAPVLTASPLEITFPSVPAYSMYEYMGLTARAAADAPPPQLQQPAVCNAVGWPIFVAPAPPRGTQPVLMPWTDDMYNEVMSLYNMLSANQQASFEAIVGQARTVGEIADKMFTGFPFSQLQPSPLVMPSAHDCFMPEPLPPPMLGSQLLQSPTADQLAQQAAQAAISQEMQLSPTWLFNMDEEEAASEEGEEVLQSSAADQPERQAAPAQQGVQTPAQASDRFINYWKVYCKTELSKDHLNCRMAFSALMERLTPEFYDDATIINGFIKGPSVLLECAGEADAMFLREELKDDASCEMIKRGKKYLLAASFFHTHKLASVRDGSFVNRHYQTIPVVLFHAGQERFAPREERFVLSLTTPILLNSKLLLDTLRKICCEVVVKESGDIILVQKDRKTADLLSFVLHHVKCCGTVIVCAHE